MSNDKFKNFKAHFSDGSTRIKYIGGFAVIGIVCIAGYLMMSSFASKKTSVEQSQLPGVPTRYSPGDGQTQNMPPEYNALLQKKNASDAAAAASSGASAVPVIRPGVNQTQAASAPTVAQMGQPTAISSTNQQAAALKQQQYQAQLTTYQQAVSVRAAAMKNQVNLLLAAWQPQDHTTTPVMDLAAKKLATTQRQGSSTEGQASTSSAQTQKTTIVARAADKIYYGQLMTTINTDIPGPVIATIVERGRLSQAKLIGEIKTTQNSEQAGLHFGQMSLPGVDVSIPIDAWAIDPKTSLSALGEADNHVFSRYLAMFASSFLSGYGDALIKGGQDQQLVSSTTGSVVQSSAYTPKQMVMNGIANVGKAIGSNMSDIMNRPRTITIPKNIGIGIVFVSDVVIK